MSLRGRADTARARCPGRPGGARGGGTVDGGRGGRPADRSPDDSSACDGARRRPLQCRACSETSRGAPEGIAILERGADLAQAANAPADEARIRVNASYLAS